MGELIDLILCYFPTLFPEPSSLFLFGLVRLGYVSLPLRSFPTSNPFLPILHAFFGYLNVGKQLIRAKVGKPRVQKDLSDPRRACKQKEEEFQGTGYATIVAVRQDWLPPQQVAMVGHHNGNRSSPAPSSPYLATARPIVPVTCHCRFLEF